MEVLGLWRHAVKSLPGERLESARFEDDGLVGDRRWGIRDLRTGRILTARRRPELLGAVASYDGDLKTNGSAAPCQSGRSDRRSSSPVEGGERH